MPSHAAFLRGINVGGHRVTGETLRQCLEGIGIGEVATFRASGNVVFAADSGPTAELTGRIEAALEGGLGYEVPVFLRTAAGMREIAAREPFTPAQLQASKGKPQVLLLGKPPAKRAREAVLALASDRDPLAIEGAELHWLPSGGTLDSDLDLKAIERLLGRGTMRTAGTVAQIAAKFFAD